jgi:hypothetical protein
MQSLTIKKLICSHECLQTRTMHAIINNQIKFKIHHLPPTSHSYFKLNLENIKVPYGPSYTHTYIHTHIYIYTYIYTYPYIYAVWPALIRLYHIRLNIYIHTYTHTHTHIHAPKGGKFLWSRAAQTRLNCLQ